MAEPKYSIRQQITAVEMQIVNRQGFVDILKEQVAKGKRPTTELAIAEMYLPALRAAMVTLKFVEEHLEGVRALAGAGTATVGERPEEGAGAVHSLRPGDPRGGDVLERPDVPY